MLEPIVRNNLHRLHNVYDRVPSPARHLLTSARGLLLAKIRYSGEAMRVLQRLRNQECWSADEIGAYQVAKLQETIEHARKTTRHYRSYPKLRLRTADDLRALPILSREVVRREPALFFSESVLPRERIHAGTTGTTGANLIVAYSKRVLAENWAFLLRQWAWAGVPPRTPRLTLFGARIIPPEHKAPPYWTYNVAERQLLLSIFHISAKTAPEYLDCLSRHAGKVLEGFPSVLAILADFAERRGLKIPMRAIFTSGEPLYPHARERIERVFRSRIFDSYGMTELCGLIQECEAGQMHLAPEYGYLEILDDHGEPVASGEEGHFVWTGFLNPAMPLIRYRLGDRGKWQTGAPCACGRAFPRVVPTITRESDVLRAPDGRLFSPRALNQLLKQTTALRFCQFVHDRHDRVVVRAVASGALGFEEVMKVRVRLQQLLGPAANVTAELSEAPISRQGGKIPLIVNQVPQ